MEKYRKVEDETLYLNVGERVEPCPNLDEYDFADSDAEPNLNLDNYF
tara:strand:+ start:2548 stop:2688 length:141 start_codon:yes stop_codon:yes gene_type:complete